MGSNPRPSAGRFNTDLPGGLDEAKALFRSLTMGQAVKTEISDRGVMRFTADDGTQLRINAEGYARIDRPDSIARKYRETIHFKNR